MVTTRRSVKPKSRAVLSVIDRPDTVPARPTVEIPAVGVADRGRLANQWLDEQDMILRLADRRVGVDPDHDVHRLLRGETELKMQTVRPRHEIVR